VRATTASRIDAATGQRAATYGQRTGSTTRCANTTPGRPGRRAWRTGTATRSSAAPLPRPCVLRRPLAEARPPSWSH